MVVSARAHRSCHSFVLCRLMLLTEAVYPNTTQAFLISPPLEGSTFALRAEKPENYEVVSKLWHCTTDPELLCLPHKYEPTCTFLLCFFSLSLSSETGSAITSSCIGLGNSLTPPAGQAGKPVPGYNGKSQNCRSISKVLNTN